MCTLALVALFVAAVLTVPALARIVGAAVIILLAVAMVAAFAAPADAPTVFSTDARLVVAADMARPTPCWWNPNRPLQPVTQ